MNEDLMYCEARLRDSANRYAMSLARLEIEFAGGRTVSLPAAIAASECFEALKDASLEFARMKTRVAQASAFLEKER